MKDAILAVLVAILAFLMWNGRQTGTYTASPLGIPTDTAAAIPPEITGAIVEKFQQQNPDLYPIETLFVNPQKESGVFNSRFMFFNTKHFYGVQYDIEARVDDSGATILKQSRTSQPDPNYGYVPDKYQSWQAIDGIIDAQLKEALSKPLPSPNLDSLMKRV